MVFKTKNLSLLLVLCLLIGLLHPVFAEESPVGTYPARNPEGDNEIMAFSLTLNASEEDGLQVQVSTDGQALVDNLLGQGMKVSNVQLAGGEGSAGFFTGGENIIGFDKGIILSTGHVDYVVGPNKSDNKGYPHGLPGDPDLTSLIPQANTWDAAIMEFDFIPESNLLTFQYVFASEEYNEFVGSGYNDVFAFFVNGENVALIPDTTHPVSINTVNGGNPLGTNPSFSQFYRNNDLSDGGGDINTEMDGLTTVLPIQAPVNPGVINHIKLAIADAGDTAYDSVVFIKAKSMSAAPPKPGKLEFKQNSYEIEENVAGGEADIEIIRTGGSDGLLHAKFQTVYKDGTANAATPGVDFEEINTSIVFEDGETSQIVKVPIIDDDLMEGDEIVGLMLTDSDFEEIFDTADLIIIDDDKAPQFRFSNESYSVQEYVYGYHPYGNIAKITVQLTGNLNHLIEPTPVFYSQENGSNKTVCSVVYSTSDGTAKAGLDYISTSGTLSFTWEELMEGIREKDFKIPILDDTIYEGTETVNLTLSSPTGSIELGTPKEAVLNILDNENPPSSGGGGGSGSSSSKSSITPVKEIPPATDNLPDKTLVNRMLGYITLCAPEKITKAKSQITLEYDAKLLEGKPQHTPRVYYWRPDEKKWVALATYPTEDGKVKAINEGDYTGWFVVFGVKQPRFIDVDGHWAEQIINRMNGLQIIEGYHIKDSEDLLRTAGPERAVTRAEFTIFIYKILNINPHDQQLVAVTEANVNEILSLKYTDANDIPDWAKQKVATVSQVNLIPFEGTAFQANMPITRLEAAIMISRALKMLKKFKTADLDGFIDIDQIPDWAKLEIVENAIQGYPDNTIRPNNDITRAEALTMLHKLFVRGMSW